MTSSISVLVEGTSPERHHRASVVPDTENASKSHANRGNKHSHYRQHLQPILYYRSANSGESSPRLPARKVGKSSLYPHCGHQGSMCPQKSRREKTTTVSKTVFEQRAGFARKLTCWPSRSHWCWHPRSLKDCLRYVLGK
jgi:hypothetical protein